MSVAVLRVLGLGSCARPLTVVCNPCLLLASLDHAVQPGKVGHESTIAQVGSVFVSWGNYPLVVW